MSSVYRPGPGCLLCDRAAWRHPSADCSTFVYPGVWWERALGWLLRLTGPRSWK